MVADLRRHRRGPAAALARLVTHPAGAATLQSMGDASPRASRRRRWRNRLLAGAAVYLVGFVAWQSVSRPAIAVHSDSELRITQFVVDQAGTNLRVGWRHLPDAVGPAVVLQTIEPPNTDVLASIMALERTWKEPQAELHWFELASGRELGFQDDAWGAFERPFREPSCFHRHVGRAESCAGPGPCLAQPDPLGIEFDTSEGRRRLQCGPTGHSYYFVIDDLEEGERVVQDELGDFAWMESWPELHEAQRTVLHYGDTGRWRELAEVRLAEGEEDDRWPIRDDDLGLAPGLMQPLAGRIADDGVTEILVAYRDSRKWSALQLRLGEELELQSKVSLPAARLAYVDKMRPLDAHAVEQGFALALCSLEIDDKQNSLSLRLVISLPGLGLQDHLIPIRLAPGQQVLPSTSAPMDLLQLALVPLQDQDGDGMDDWMALVLVDGSIPPMGSRHSSRPSAAVAVELSGASGAILPRKQAP